MSRPESDRPAQPSPEEIFHEARAIADPAARAAFFEAACVADPALRAKVNALLQADAEAGSFMETRHPAAGSTLRESMPLLERPGQTIGRYKLLQLIGEGGFGAVFMAEQSEPVRRRVALKVIKPGMDSRMVAARFEAERQALALMDHPHIARVLDGGITDAALGARPYFVMEYVIGDPITNFADAHKLSIPARLALFAQVCQAVQHAHTKGIIHRDLKPTNVLVSMTDGRPFAKVIDFGIAKSLASRLTDKTLFTEHRQLIGTPEYMSPEQAEGSPDIDTRTDVYALGVLLYELLTGATPFDAARLRSAAFAEMQRIIKEEEPPAPSVRLLRKLPIPDAGPEVPSGTKSPLSGTHARSGTRSHDLRGELDWIVMKALDKDRARRYETPSQLAQDVERHLAGDAILAAPPSAAYRMRKFVRRHKGPVLTGSAVAAALVLGIVATTWQTYMTEQQRCVAEAAIGEFKTERQNLADSYVRVLSSAGYSDVHLDTRGLIRFVTPFGEQGYEWLTRPRIASNSMPMDQWTGNLFTDPLAFNVPGKIEEQLGGIVKQTQTANTRLTSQADAAVAMLTRLVVAPNLVDPDARIRMETAPAGDPNRLIIYYLGPSKDVIIIDPVANPDLDVNWEFETVAELPRQSVPTEKIVKLLGGALETKQGQLLAEIKRARLAEASVIVNAVERYDPGNEDDYARLRDLDVKGALATRVEYLGMNHADTIRAEMAMWTEELEGWEETEQSAEDRGVEKWLDWDARRRASGDVAAIDVEICSKLAQSAWERRELVDCLALLHRLGTTVPIALHDDDGRYYFVSHPRKPWASIGCRGGRGDSLRAIANDLRAANLASLHRSVALYGEEPERATAIERAEQLDAVEGSSPNPANLAVRAVLAARNSANPDALLIANNQLDDASELMLLEQWTNDSEAKELVAAATRTVRPDPTPERQLTDQINQGRLTEAALRIERARLLAELYGDEDENEKRLMDDAIVTLTEVLGSEHSDTAKARLRRASLASWSWTKDDRSAQAVRLVDAWVDLLRYVPTTDPEFHALLSDVHTQWTIGIYPVEARTAALAQLRALMADPANAETFAKDADAQALLAEAEALIDP